MNAKQIINWEMDWMYRISKWDMKDQREELAGQLKTIRKYVGNKVAKQFIYWLCWIGIYPIRKRII